MGRVDSGEAEKRRRNVDVGPDPVESGTRLDSRAANDHGNSDVVIVYVELAGWQPVLAQVVSAAT